MARRAWLAALLIVVGAESAGAANQEQWPTHLELLQGAVHDAAAGLTAGLADSVGLVAVAVHPSEATLVHVAVQNALLARRRRVTAEMTGSPCLHVTVERLEVTIPEGRRRWLVGARRLHRRARVEVSAELQTGDGLTVWQARADAARDDWVPESTLALLEGPAAYGCAPAAPAERWVRLVEPVIVMSSVAAVLYLFFTK